MDKRQGKYSDLKMGTGRSLKGGKLVFAVIGNYKGRGRQRLILHEAQLEVDSKGNPQFVYGNGKIWNFPTGKGRVKKK